MHNNRLKHPVKPEKAVGEGWFQLRAAAKALQIQARLSDRSRAVVSREGLPL